jgi:hypothetical protein
MILHVVHVEGALGMWKERWACGRSVGEEGEGVEGWLFEDDG